VIKGENNRRQRGKARVLKPSIVLSIFSQFAYLYIDRVLSGEHRKGERKEVRESWVSKLHGTQKIK